MATTGKGLTREFTNGVVYAVLQLDDLQKHMAGGVSTTKLLERPDGKFDVSYKPASPCRPAC